MRNIFIILALLGALLGVSTPSYAFDFGFALGSMSAEDRKSAIEASRQRNEARRQRQLNQEIDAYNRELRNLELRRQRAQIQLLEFCIQNPNHSRCH